MRGSLAVMAALVLMLGQAPHAAATPQVQASLTAGSVEAGAGVTLLVAVTDPGGATSDPQFTLPRGLSILASEQGQSTELVGGRVVARIEYRYAIGTEEAGRFAIGPIRVRLGRQVYECPVPVLVVTATAARRAPVARSAAGASFVVEVRPQHPYVGQLVQMTLKLVQTRDLDESGGNSTPSTTGFWAEGYGDPVESRTVVGGRPAGVTERRARVYPLVPGAATIGSASIMVRAAGGGDASGGAGAAPLEIRSEPVRLEVRPLPAGAPSGFDNAVGSFWVAWTLDRGHTAQDQSVRLALDFRGSGNLPLLHPPALDFTDFEVYSTTVEDSFAPAGETGTGRRRFVWTVMPRRAGTLRIPPPRITWFDPAAGAYRSGALPPLEVEVLAAGADAEGGRAAGTFPDVFAHDPARPGGRPARPWAFAIAGALLGLGVRWWRASRVDDPLAADRARMRELLRGVGLARGPDFWSAADEATEWVAARGGQVLRLAEEIAAARFSGRPAPEEDVRRRLVERLSGTLPAEASRLPAGAIAGGFAVVSVLVLFAGAGVGGEQFGADRAAQADALARAGRIEEARPVWESLRHPSEPNGALMARLAWAELRRERPGAAARLLLDARTCEARDPALAWVGARVREAGGLVGAPGAAPPLRSLEWAALAFAFALGAVLEWPKRVSAGVLLGLSLLAAAALPLDRLANPPAAWAVVQGEFVLPGTDVSLQAGEVVRVLAAAGDSVRVRAAHDLEGAVPDTLLVRSAGARR